MPEIITPWFRLMLSEPLPRNTPWILPLPRGESRSMPNLIKKLRLALRLRLILWLAKLRYAPRSIHYVGTSEVLPPPLTREE